MTNAYDKRVKRFMASHGTPFRALNKTKQRELLSLIESNNGREARKRVAAYDRERKDVRNARDRTRRAKAALRRETFKRLFNLFSSSPNFSPTRFEQSFSHATDANIEYYARSSDHGIYQLASSQSEEDFPDDYDYDGPDDYIENPLFYH